MDIIASLAHKIRKLASRKDSIFIALDGPGGCGKSTLSKHLKSLIPALKVICTDFYHDPSLNRVDFMRVKNELLISLINNKVARAKIYDWPNKKFTDGANVKPGGIFLFEGTYAMEKNLIDLYDYRIWVDCPPEIGMKRALARDNEAEKENWQKYWMPMMKKYVKSQEPYRKTDVVINYSDIPEFRM